MTGFFDHCRYEKNLSAKTLKFYTIDLLQFSAFLELQCFPLVGTEIDKAHLKGYLQELSVWKPKTIKPKVATLKALLNYLESRTISTFCSGAIFTKSPEEVSAKHSFPRSSGSSRK